MVFVAAAALLALAQTKAFPTIKELMTPDEFKACGLSKLDDKELLALDTWVQKQSIRVAQAVAQKGGIGVNSGPLSFDQLEGYSIVADDGEFLGTISNNTIDSKSILNEIGKYGSVISSVSIFNTIGKYGSETSSLSAFSEITSTPPHIINKDGIFVAYLTVNPLKNPRVNPHALVGWLKSK